MTFGIFIDSIKNKDKEILMKKISFSLFNTSIRYLVVQYNWNLICSKLAQCTHTVPLRSIYTDRCKVGTRISPFTAYVLCLSLVYVSPWVLQQGAPVSQMVY